jgi:predicted PurR-regulated permease PerM
MADATRPEDDPSGESEDAGRRGDRDEMPRWVPRLIVLYFVGLAVFGVAQWLLGRLETLLLDIFVALFLSFALEPAVKWLQARGWRRGWATGASFLGLVVFSSVFVFAIGAVVFDQISQFIESAPQYAEDGARFMNDRFGTNIEVDSLQEELTREDGPAQEIATRLAGNVLAVGVSALGVLFRLLAISLFTFYLVADGPKLRRTVCSVLPQRHQRQVLETWEIAIDKTGGYLYSRALLAVLSALAHWIAFEIIGLPYAAAIALFVGVVSQFVPTVGTYIAGALPIVVGLANDPVKAFWVLLVVVVYQQIENVVFAPRVTARTMSLHPAVAFGTVIAGAALFGATGALLALPAAAVLQALGSTYITRHDVVDSHMTADTHRFRRRWFRWWREDPAQRVETSSRHRRSD